MSQLKFLLLFSLLAIGLQSCSNTESDSPAIKPQLDATAYTELLDVEYGSEERQKLDIYLPANRSTDTKVLILVHGGAWTSGQKENMNEIVDLIKAELPNLAIMNMNYRLASFGTPPFPMQIDDITLAVNFLKENKDNYVISNDIGFLGTSAGGQLSLLWSYAHDAENDVEMVASIVGPTNFTDPAYTETNEYDVFSLLAFFGLDTSTEFLKTVSPYHQATASSPPTVLFYGGNDELVPNSQGDDMEAKLNELDVTHSYTFYPNQGHQFDEETIADTWVTLKSFIQIHLM